MKTVVLATVVAIAAALVACDAAPLTLEQRLLSESDVRRRLGTACHAA
jgi:hypothetical protein